MRYNLIGRSSIRRCRPRSAATRCGCGSLTRAGAGWRSATYSIFVDRAIGLIALAIIIVEPAVELSLITDPHGRSALMLVDLAALAAGWLSRPRHAAWPWLKQLVGNASCLGLLRGREPGHFSRDRGPSAVLSGWSTFSPWSSLVRVRSISAPVMLAGPSTCAAGHLITMVPISIAGWGVREATMGLPSDMPD